MVRGVGKANRFEDTMAKEIFSIYLCSRWAPSSDFTQILEDEKAANQLPKEEPAALYKDSPPELHSWHIVLAGSGSIILFSRTKEPVFGCTSLSSDLLVGLSKHACCSPYQGDCLDF